eukprot:TRINITY_DN2212_c0_g1_i2.p1 TRINITY_DN2212_c0_g1~~TRINITY_DN2212_c0_g1_i2.p1  ORF type:complete len:536 (-),score=118.42 TRINITY_DN2212_c0_g1_i2:1275-2690(-)
MPFAAYLDLASEIGAEIVTPIAAEAMPGGPVTLDAYTRMVDAIVNAVETSNCDAAMLDIHGAMVTDSDDITDGEGELLERIRKKRPDLPIAVTCDLHGNLTDKMVKNCTVLIGYKTYPHVDMYAVGYQVGKIFLRSLTGEVKPVMAWGNRPILAQTLKMGTDDEPMKEIMRIATEMENDKDSKILAATFFGGFPMADFKFAGISAICIADGDQEAAQAAVDKLLNQAWQERENFIYKHEPLEQAIARAKKLGEEPYQGDPKPIILLDHADNCGSGATQDVMTVIKEIIKQGLDDVAVAAVWDPEAVKTMNTAGVGSTITIQLGGKSEMPSIGLKGQPLELTGKVKTISDGEWIVRGPMYTGVKVFMGLSAVFEVPTGNGAGKMQIVVVSRHHEPWDQGVFLNLGIDPKYKRYLLLKSRIHYRAGFAPLARATITCDGEGVTTSDNSLLKFKRLRRPIYPIDTQIDTPASVV